MQKVAFVITCKGRLHHVQQTLPRIVEQVPAEIILVDYACPDNTGDWVESNYPSVKVVRVTDDPGFCLPRARNIGAKNSVSPWLCFIDADIKIQPGWVEWMSANLAPDFFYRAAAENGERNDETYGTFICSRLHFEQLAGYDEAFRGWGGEDDDLYARLRDDLQLQESTYPSEFVEPISHDDAERTTFHDVKGKEVQRFINDCYIRVKQYILRNHASELSLETRRSMMEQIKRQFAHSEEAQQKTYSVELEVPRVICRDGSFQDLVVELNKQRKFVVFGKRELSMNVRAASPSRQGASAVREHAEA